MIQVLSNSTPIEASRPIRDYTCFNIADNYPKPSYNIPSRTVAEIKSYEIEGLNSLFHVILLGAALVYIGNLERLSLEEDSYFLGVPYPPSSNAIQVFKQIRELGLKEKGILKRYVALEEGGILLEFQKGGGSVTFEIDNDGDAACLVERGGNSRIFDIDTNQLTSEVLKAFE